MKINHKIVLIALIFLGCPSLMNSQQWIKFKNTESKVEAHVVHKSSAQNAFKYVLDESTDTLIMNPNEVESFFYKKHKDGDLIFKSFKTKDGSFQFFRELLINKLKIYENYKSKNLGLVVDDKITELDDKKIEKEVLNKILPYDFSLKNRTIGSDLKSLKTLDQVLSKKIRKYPGVFVGAYASYFSTDLGYEYDLLRESNDLSPFLSEYFNQDQIFSIQNLDLGLYMEYPLVTQWELSMPVRVYYSRQDVKNFNEEDGFQSSLNGQLDYAGLELGVKKVFSRSSLFPFFDLGFGLKRKLKSDMDFAEYTDLGSVILVNVLNPDFMPDYFSLFLGVGVEIPYTKRNYIMLRASVESFSSSFKTKTVLPRLSVGLNIL